MATSQQAQTSLSPKIGFDPNAMSFGGGIISQKFFNTFGGQQGNNIFVQNTSLGQQNQNPTTGLNIK